MGLPGVTKQVGTGIGTGTPGKVNNQLIRHYWDYEGTTDLELESNREYRFIGEGSSNFRNGTWGAKGSTLYFDDKSCQYTYGKDPDGSSQDVLNIQCGDGSVFDRTWSRKPKG